MQTTKVYVANEDTMELQLMTQPIVDVATGDLYLKLDDVETLLTDIKANQTNGTQATKLQIASTATLTTVPGNASSVSIKAANTSRLGLTVVNDSSSVLYLAYASTASATGYTYRINAYETFEMPQTMLYTGLVTGIWATATGNAYITELT